MAGAFRIAEGYVEVTADESAYDTAMDRLKAKKHKVSITADLDTRAAADDLAVLTRDRIAKITARVDTTGAATQLHFSDRIVNLLPELEEAALRLAEEQLGILTRDRTVRIIADLDTRAAADDLALLTRARTTRITADADTNGARADLDVLARDRRVNVQVDLDRSALSRLTSLFSGGGGGGSDGMLGKLRDSASPLPRWARRPLSPRRRSCRSVRRSPQSRSAPPVSATPSRRRSRRPPRRATPRPRRRTVSRTHSALWPRRSRA
jgi:hypothetical protein